MPINKNIEFKQKENLYFNNQNKNELILPKHNDKAINKIKTMADDFLGAGDSWGEIFDE